MLKSPVVPGSSRQFGCWVADTRSVTLDPSSCGDREPLDDRNGEATDGDVFSGNTRPTTRTSPVERGDYLWEPLFFLGVGLGLMALGSASVYFAFVNDGWIYALSGARYWSTVAAMTLVAGVAPAMFIVALPAFANVLDTRTPRRVQAMYWGLRTFERATPREIEWLTTQPVISQHPTFKALGDLHKARVWAFLRGEPGRGGRPDAPVVAASTVARWILTGEDIGLLVSAVHSEMADEALLGYLDGDAGERAAFEFLVSLAFRPAA
jgi:hypothetical protein